MSNLPADPNPDEEWLRVLKTGRDELHTEADTDRLAVIIEAMRHAGDALTPSADTRHATWQKIEQAMDKKSPPVQPDRHFLSRRFWGLPVFVPALMASGAVMVIGMLVLTMQTQNAGMDVVAMRGGANRIPVQDFSAQQPKPLQELRDMGLQVEVQRDAAQISLTITASDPPSPALLKWASRWGVTPMPGGKWHVVLVPSPSNKP